MAKKKSVLLILIVMLAFFAFAGLASCGGPASSSESNSETVKETETAGQTETVSGTDTTGETTSETAGETTSETTGESTSESTVAPEVKYTVKFVNGETEVASVEVKEGETVAQADIPVAPESDYVFYGWFNGDVEFDATVAVTENVTYVAKFSTIKVEHIGEWRGEGKDGNANSVAYVLTVTGETISLKVGAADAVAATDIAYDEAYGDLTFAIGDDAYTMGVWYNTYFIATADYSVNVNISLVYDKPVEFGEDALVGAFETEAGVEIVINGTFVLIDGVQGTDFASSSNGYSFYIDGASASVFYDSYAEAWYYQVGGEDDKIKTPVKEPVAIPEALIGNWSGVVEDAWGTTLYLVTITSDGISVYTDAVGWSDVVASYEAVEGGVIFNIGGDKITVTATADGKIQYVGNYTDVTLEKKIRIAFINDYQIYYIATLNDDGTIDEENFALEDPAKDHNHFDGWFEQIGGAEFDYSATFEKGAYFEAKWTETEIPVKFDDTTIYVPVTDGVAKLTEALIPAAPEAEEGKTFMGWYNGDVKAVAGLEVKKNAKFVSYFAAEADYAGYWTCNEAGKETMLVVTDGKLTFGKDFKQVQYTYADGQLSAKTGKLSSTKWINVEKTKTGVVVSVKYYDEYGDEVTDEYVLEPIKAVKGVIPAGTYKSTRSDGFIINEDGVITNCGSSLDASMYSYVSGTASNLTIRFIDNGNLKEYKNVRVKDGKIICGNIKADAKVYVKDPKSVDEISEVNGVFTIYKYTVVNKDSDGKDQESVIYVINKDGHYAEMTITGEIVTDNVVTIKYGFYNGTTKKETFEEQYKITNNGKLASASAEKGEYTNETLGTLKLDGFGNATLTNGEDVKTYSYVVNGAGIIVLKDAEGAIVDGVTLGDENTFAKAEAVGEYGKYINSNSPKYTMVIDQFGGATMYYSSYVYYGKYTVDAAAGTITVSDINYSYNGVYVKYDDGKVYINDTKITPVILIVEGYTPVNHIDEFAGYYVNGDDVIKIVVADGKATVLVNKVDVKAKANWNGTEITYKAVDPDSPISGVETTYIVTKNGENIVVKYKKCIGLDEYGEEPAFADDYTILDYTATEEPEEVDAFAGTWVLNDLKFIFDGKGTVTNENGVTATYSIVSGKAKFVINYVDIECTVNGNKMDVDYDDGDYQFSKTFTKQEEEVEELDAFAGSWKVYDTVFAFNGKGTVVVTGAYAGTFSYTVSGDTVTFKNTSLNEDITCKLSGTDAILVSCECGEEYSNTKFTKQ